VRLKDNKAIVTGGASGIGRAVCLALAREGADILVADIQDAIETVKVVQALARRAISVITDVTAHDQVEAMVDKAVQEFGRVDILVNDAGIAILKPFFETNEVDWDRQMNVNAKGVFLVSQAVARVMRDQGGGRIINISSISADRAGTHLSAYCASKAPVSALTLCLALELAEYGIYVNAVLPGTTETTLNREWHKTNPAMRQANIEGTPLKRLGRPEDIANAVVYLASEEASWTTGALLRVDGGYCVK